MSSIQWCNQSFHSPKTDPKNPKILIYSIEILASDSSNSRTDSPIDLFQAFQWLWQVQLDELYPMACSDFHNLNYDFHILYSAIYDTENHSLGYGKSEHIIG